MRNLASGANKKKAKKGVPQEPSPLVEQKKTTPNEDLYPVLGDDKIDNLTVLGMRHKNLLLDHEDAAVLSMYNRKIGMKDF